MEIGIIQVRHGDLNQDRSRRGGVKRSDFGLVLKIELAGFIDLVDMGHIERKKSRMIPIYVLVNY